MKYIDADLLRKEIDKWVEAMADAIGDYSDGVRFALQHFTFVLDSLQQKQQEVDLEKEIDRFYGMYRKDGKTFDLTDNEQCMDWKMNCNSDFKIGFARHFYELGKNSK